MMKLAGGDPHAIRDMASHPVNFMYVPPPGMERVIASSEKETAGVSRVVQAAKHNRKRYAY